LEPLFEIQAQRPEKREAGDYVEKELGTKKPEIY